MGNAFVAVDAGSASAQRLGMIFSGKMPLPFHRHGLVRMAIPALPRITVLHGLPNVSGEFQALGLKFFGGVDGTCYPVKHFLAGFDFTYEFARPLLRYMAISTNGLYAGGIPEMNALLIFLVNRRLHFMAGDTKFKRIGRLHPGIKNTPESDTDDEKEHR